MYNINEYVKIKESNIIGKVIRKNGEKCLILAGTNKIYVNEDLLEKAKKIPEIKSNVSINLQSHEDQDIDEIMLRHQQKEEALINLDKFIDTAICNRRHKVKIIHGKNGGILRNAVHNYLKENPNVISYSLGDYYEGSYGVTIAYLK